MKHIINPEVEIINYIIKFILLLEASIGSLKKRGLIRKTMNVRQRCPYICMNIRQ